MRHFSKKTASIKPELIQKISAAVYFIPVRVLFCKNFVGKVQSKCENAQKEPRKQICQQQTGYPRTLKTYIMASYYCFLRLFSAKIALDFQSWMKYFHIDASQNRNKILFSAMYFFAHFAWFCLLLLHISYVRHSENEGFSRKKNWTQNVLM